MSTKVISTQLKNYELLKFQNEIERDDFNYVIESINKTIQNCKNIILDFSDLTFLSSSAIKSIIKSHKAVKSLNGHLIVLIESKNFDILQSTKLDTVIPCFKSLESLTNHLN